MNRDVKPFELIDTAEPYTEHDLTSGTYFDLTRQLTNERACRANQGFFGAWDAMLAVKGSILLGTLGEAVQTERAGYLAQEAQLQASYPNSNVQNLMAVNPHSHDPYMLLASIPLDLKAVAVSVAAFGAVSAARRVRRHERFPRDVANAVQQARQAERFVPHDEHSGRMFRFRRRLADAAITATAMTASYQAAKYGTQVEDLAAVGALNVTAVGSIYTSRYLNRRAIRKMQQAFSNSDPDFNQ